MNIDYAGGQRIAMRTGAGTGTSGLSFLLPDHLGSPAVTVNAATNAVTRTGYKPWGEERYGTAPSIFGYTGQRDEPDLDILFYGARWYDPSKMQFIQPDTLVPNQYNVQDWNRYSYARNHPIRYTDPTGHAQDLPDDGGCDSICRNRTRQTELLTKILVGSSPKGTWTGNDYKYYYANLDGIWGGSTPWVNPDPPGWDTFALHVGRLARYYANNERDQFVRDFSLLFSGIRYDVPWQDAAIEVAGGHTLRFFNEGTQGLPSEYLDTIDSIVRPENNQLHHYTGLFFLGFFTDSPTGVAVNVFRDTIDPGIPPRIAYNPGDIALGNVAVAQGSWLRHAWAQNSAFENPIMDLADMIAALAR